MVVQDGYGASAKDKQFRYEGVNAWRDTRLTKREQHARSNPVQTGPDGPGHWSPAGTRIDQGGRSVGNPPGPGAPIREQFAHLRKPLDRRAARDFYKKAPKRRLTGGPLGHPGLR